MRHAFLLGISFLALGLGAGCARESASLSVRSEQTDAQYVATFDRALFSPAGDGQIDLILLAGAPGRNASINLPLQARPGQAVQQVVHMRVLWAPKHAIRIDSPSASNATVNWHVIAGSEDHLTYTGACWAKVDVDGNSADVDLRNATITIRSLSGNVADPLKRARLKGEFTAVRADSAVQSYLAELARLNDRNAATAVALP